MFDKKTLRSIRKSMPFLADVKSVYDLLVSAPRTTYTCPCCGTTSRFRTFGLPPRLNALCCVCGSVERHRMIRLYLQDRQDLFAGKRVLHFAPEDALRPWIQGLATQYVPCDYMPEGDEIKVNIEAMQFEDDAFDFIVCNHILEHVDYVTALRELRRVLKPGGTMILSFPVIMSWPTTYENAEVTTVKDRILHFGQYDHVRYFGADVQDRIVEAGFEVEPLVACEPEVHRYGLLRGETLFICR